MAAANAAAKTRQILAEMKQGIYHPIYLLMGDEGYYIDLISDYIEQHALQDFEREFNQTVLYGLETNPLDLVSVVKRYPMMAERQVVILKEGQRMKNFDKLEPIIEEPVPTTIFVICHKEKKLDGRWSITKLLNKKAVVVESSKIKENEVASWIRDYCKSHKIDISNDALQVMAEHIGPDLERIVSEFGKLEVALPKGTSITPEVIEKHVGISKDYNVYELQKAIAMKDLARALKIARHFANNPKAHPVIATNGALIGYFTKLYLFHHVPDSQAASALRINPYFLNEYRTAARNFPVGKVESIFGYLRETDLKAKGVNNVTSDDGALLEELIFKILH
ncbi:MAG: DNA polymerase III subunit delta [Cryomorphaceae bacterium]|nr:MAG: DNA polymerase III subunit delta [Cryomorphaceae bacterium]